MTKIKTNKYIVTSKSKIEYSCEIEAEDQDEAIKKAINDDNWTKDLDNISYEVADY